MKRFVFSIILACGSLAAANRDPTNRKLDAHAAMNDAIERMNEHRRDLVNVWFGAYASDLVSEHRMFLTNENNHVMNVVNDREGRLAYEAKSLHGYLVAAQHGNTPKMYLIVPPGSLYQVAVKDEALRVVGKPDMAERKALVESMRSKKCMPLARKMLKIKTDAPPAPARPLPIGTPTPNDAPNVPSPSVVQPVIHDEEQPALDEQVQSAPPSQNIFHLQLPEDEKVDYGKTAVTPQEGSLSSAQASWVAGLLIAALLSGGYSLQKIHQLVKQYRGRHERIHRSSAWQKRLERSMAVAGISGTLSLVSMLSAWLVWQQRNAVGAQ